MALAMQMSDCFTETAQKRGEAATWSDCWPDSVHSVEETHVIDACARKNSPGIVLGEAARMLAGVLLVVALIDVFLRLYHFQ